MPYLNRPGAKLFFDDVGEGEPIITIHGFIENGSFWGRTGVSGALVDAGYRVVDLDMRGHGRSVPEGEVKDYAVESVAADIGALADHLGFQRFHLLSHATGGMAALRYAMNHSDRLLSLISSDTSSATIPLEKYCGPEWDDTPIPPDPDLIGFAGQYSSQLIREHANFNHMIDALRRNFDSQPLAPYLNRFAANSDPERCWRWVEDIYAVNNPAHCIDFALGFYSDLDPRVAGLRRIKCPNLVIVGEHDIVMRKPAEQLARCIPQAELVVLEGLGHMIAIENPVRVTAEILGFLRQI